MQLQTTSPESKFPNKYTHVIFIQIDQHLKKLLPKYKGVPILWNTVLYFTKCGELWRFCFWHLSLWVFCLCMKYLWNRC